MAARLDREAPHAFGAAIQSAAKKMMKVRNIT